MGPILRFTFVASYRSVPALTLPIQTKLRLPENCKPLKHNNLSTKESVCRTQCPEQ